MNIDTSENKDAVAEHTGQWLEKAVIGLNLCPFAKAPHVKNLVRIAISEAKHLDGFWKTWTKNCSDWAIHPPPNWKPPCWFTRPYSPISTYSTICSTLPMPPLSKTAWKASSKSPRFIPISNLKARIQTASATTPTVLLSDAAPHPRRQHCQSRTSLSRRFGNIRTQYRPAGKNGT